MPRSHDPALEQRECRLHGIRADRDVLIADIFVGAMVDALVPRLAMSCGAEIVELRFVSHDDFDARIHIPSNDVVDALLIHVVGFNEVQMTTALPDADHSTFVLQLSLVTMLLATDIGFVHFDCPGEFVARLRHCSANSVAQVPRGLVADSERAVDLIRAHALTGFAEQVCCKKPLPQRQVRVMEDRASRDGELIAA